MPETTALVARVVALRRAVADHKSAIRQRRQQLQRDKAALVALETECLQRGIGVVTRPTSSVSPGAGGLLHGRTQCPS